MAEKELRASGVMAASGPLLNFCLNIGLTMVVVVGAYRVNAGLTQAGKIVAFLTYFTLILNAVIAINRIFVMFSNMIVNMLTDLNAEQMLLFSMVNKYNFVYNNCRQLLFFKTVNFILYFYF